MSVNSIIDTTSIDPDYKDKIFPDLIPWNAPAGQQGLGAVLQINNSALTPLGAIPQDATDFNTIGCVKIETGTVGQGNNLSLVVGEAGDNLQIKGATLLGSMLVGNGVNTETLAVPSPALPNGSVLILDSTQPLGMRWGGESGDINSITPGLNIDITGPTANPIVALQAPLTSTLNVGTQNITGTNGHLTLTPTLLGIATIDIGGGAIVATNNPFNITNTNNLLILTGGIGIDLTASAGDINLDTPGGLVYINGSAYPPTAVSSVSAGTNISLTGTASVPIVNLKAPLTSTLNMGAVAITDSASSTGTNGQYLTAGTGAQTLWATLPAPPATPALSAVLNAGNTAVNSITLEDATTPATYNTVFSKNGYTITEATGSPTYSTTAVGSSTILQDSNGEYTAIQSSLTSMYNTNSTTTYSTTGITAGNEATSIDYFIKSTQPPSPSPTGYARLDLTSGDSTIPPKVVLYTFQEYPQTTLPNINNTLTLGYNSGADTLIENGDQYNDLPVNSILLHQDGSYTNNYIQLRSAFDFNGLYSSLQLGIDDFDLTIAQFKAFTISTGSTDPVVFRRNISTTTTDASPNNPVGMLENSVINVTTTGTTTLTVANAFATIINTPTLAGRIFVLPAPTAGSVGYWYAVCNKSTANTIAVQYPALTTIATIPVATNAANGGSVARFAVTAGGASYFRVN